MSSLPTCIQCGGKEFYIESGFYFCAECQIQSQDIREEFLSDFQTVIKSRTTVIPKQNEKSKIDQHKIKGRELTSWELLNYILKGWVDELIRLGVDEQVKIITLQLWVAYLHKLEVAFTSTIVEKKPRLGFTFRHRDAELVYGTSYAQSKILRRPFSSKSSNSSRTSASSNSSLNISRIRSRKRKELAKALYDEESVISDTSHSNVSLDDLSSQSSTKQTKMCFTAHAKKTMSKLFGSMDSLPGEDEKEVNYRIAQISEMKSLRHLNSGSVFALLRLALLIAKSPVQLSDMFRWSREGYLSLRNLERLVPPTTCVTKDVKALLVNPITSWMAVTRKMYHLSTYLNIENITVDIFPICSKIAHQLHLPEDINDIIRKLLNISRPSMSLSATVNYEGRAAAFIIFILKIIFSLDGTTEVINSNAARRINKYLDKSESGEKRLFVWSDWIKSLEFRDAVISKYHIPTREQWYQGTYLPETCHAFIGQWKMAPKEKSQASGGMKASIRFTLERFLDSLACGGGIPPKPSMNPSKSLIEHISPNLSPDISIKLAKLLSAPLSASLSTYFDITRLTGLADKSGCCLRYGVPNEFRLIEKYRNKKLKPRSKYLQEVVPVSLKGDLSSSDDSQSYSSDDVQYNDSESQTDSDPDDPKWSPPKKKIKTKHSSSKSSSKKPKASNMEVLQPKGGNMVLRFDVDEIFRNFANLAKRSEPVMYVPQNAYWRLEGSFYNDGITVEEFEEYARNSFAPSFLWLLRRCSVLIDQSMRDVYKQLTFVENIYLKLQTSNHLSKRYRRKW